MAGAGPSRVVTPLFKFKPCLGTVKDYRLAVDLHGSVHAEAIEGCPRELALTFSYPAK